MKVIAKIRDMGYNESSSHTAVMYGRPLSIIYFKEGLLDE